MPKPLEASFCDAPMFAGSRPRRQQVSMPEANERQKTGVEWSNHKPLNTSILAKAVKPPLAALKGRSTGSLHWTERPAAAYSFLNMPQGGFALFRPEPV